MTIVFLVVIMAISVSSGSTIVVLNRPFPWSASSTVAPSPAGTVAPATVAILQQEGNALCALAGQVPALQTRPWLWDGTLACANTSTSASYVTTAASPPAWCRGQTSAWYGVRCSGANRVLSIEIPASTTQLLALPATLFARLPLLQQVQLFVPGPPTSQPTRPTTAPSNAPTPRPSPLPTLYPSAPPSLVPSAQPTKIDGQYRCNGRDDGTLFCWSPPGMYSIAHGPPQGCPAGTFSLAGSATCQACAPGSYSGAFASVCTPCQPGYYATAGAPCNICPLGTFSAAAGASSCTPCASSTIAPPGSSVCVPCDE